MRSTAGARSTFDVDLDRANAEPLGLEDDLGSGTGLDEEDAFEELEPLDMDAEPSESHSSIGAEKMESLEDEDPDMNRLEI